MILRPLWLLAAAIPYVFADVEFTTPAAGASVSGATISVAWKDSGVSPAISDLLSYQLWLCAGGQETSGIIQLDELVPSGNFKTGSTATAAISLTLGGNTKNAYFVKMISQASGGTVINYSSRFSIPGMTGSFPTFVTTALTSVTGTTGPATENTISQPQNAGANTGTTSSQTGDFAMAYTLQTGPTRFAPMPPMAVTKITAKGQSRQYPTSATTVATGRMATPNALTTITQSLTFAASSIENTVVAVANPTDTAMAKFLNRWKD